jgi:hypothetical protein
MGLLDSIFSAVSGNQKTSGTGEANPLLGILSGLLTQSGGLQGLANRFSQSGQADAFSSWGWYGRKSADLRRSDSKSVWFRPDQCACGENRSRPRASFKLFG